MSSSNAFIFNPEKSYPMNIFARPRDPIPLEGTLPRCGHSVYWPANDEVAWCCGLCNPLAARPGNAPENIKLPPIHRKDADELYANRNDPTRCRKCHSAVHSVEPDGRWRCADCGLVRRAPRKHRPEAELVAA